jgi:hypothetical protein
VFTRALEHIEAERYFPKLLYWTALMLALLLCLQTCAAPARQTESIDAAPTPERRTPATLVAHNLMPVGLDLFVARAGFADIYLGTLRPLQRDTFTIRVPYGSAFEYRAYNAAQWQYRAQTRLVFVYDTPVVYEWIIRTPLALRPPPPRIGR